MLSIWALNVFNIRYTANKCIPLNAVYEACPLESPSIFKSVTDDQNLESCSHLFPWQYITQGKGFSSGVTMGT